MSVILHPTQPVMVFSQIPENLNVERFLATVSPSKVVERNGQAYLTAVHNSDTVVQAMKFGLKPPTSIMSRYQWPGRFTPFDHQYTTAEFFTLYRRCLCLSDMGTGKTAAAIWAADHLMNEGLIRQALIVSTITTMDSVWQEEIVNVAPHRSSMMVYGPRNKRYRIVQENNPDFFITNHDAYRVTKLYDMLARKQIDLVIYDEASVLREGRTARYKSLVQFLRKTNPRLWMLTGTPTPNKPSDAWALARLTNPYDAETNPQGCPPAYTRFRDTVERKQGHFKWVPRANARAVVRAVLKPAIRYKKEDCTDLPDVLYTDRHAPITPDQTRAYEEMKRHMIAMAKDEDGNPIKVTAINAAAQLNKLLQIMSGSSYVDGQPPVTFDMAPKLEAMLELIKESTKKAIVFVPYRHVLSRVHEYLVGEGVTCDMVHGGVTGTARNKVIRRFTRESHPQVLIAHPKTASHGLNLTVASTTIWFGPCMSAETYIQANERMNRPGQDTKMLIAHLFCHDVERKYFQLLDDRQRMQTGILNLYNEITEDQ